VSTHLTHRYNEILSTMFFLNIDKRLTKRERNYENEEIKKDEEYFNANK
jgi:hypothetical protein